jgi:hypothetical protein
MRLDENCEISKERERERRGANWLGLQPLDTVYHLNFG